MPVGGFDKKRASDLRGVVAAALFRVFEDGGLTSLYQVCPCLLWLLEGASLIVPLNWFFPVEGAGGVGMLMPGGFR